MANTTQDALPRLLSQSSERMEQERGEYRQEEAGAERGAEAHRGGGGRKRVDSDRVEHAAASTEALSEEHDPEGAVHADDVVDGNDHDDDDDNSHYRHRQSVAAAGPQQRQGERESSSDAERQDEAAETNRPNGVGNARGSGGKEGAVEAARRVDDKDARAERQMAEEWQQRQERAQAQRESNEQDEGEDSIAAHRPRRRAAELAAAAPQQPQQQQQQLEAQRRKTSAAASGEHPKQPQQQLVSTEVPADFATPDNDAAKRELREQLLTRLAEVEAKRRLVEAAQRERVMAHATSQYESGAVFTSAAAAAAAASGGGSSSRSRGRASALQIPEASSGGVDGGQFSPSTSSSGRVRTPSHRIHSQPGEQYDPQTILRRFPQMGFALRTLNELVKLQEARSFLLPVDKLWPFESLHSYFDVIRQPMDLGTIRGKLDNGEYGTDPHAFAEDVRLVWSNAMTFNPPDTIVYQQARSLSEKFERKMMYLPPPGAAPASSAAKAKRKQQQQHAAAGLSTAAGHKHAQGASSFGAARRGVPKAGAGRRGVSNAAEQRKLKRKHEKEQERERRRQEKEREREQRRLEAQHRQRAARDEAGGAVKRRKKQFDPYDRVRELEQRMDVLQGEKRNVETMLNSSTAAASPRGGSGGGGGITGPQSKEATASLAKVPITQQEMAQLADDINHLNGSQLRKLIDVFGSRPGLLTKGDSGEYEMNIQQASNETLRELQAFCNECLRPAGREPAMSPTAAGARVAAINREMSKLNQELDKAKRMVAEVEASAQRERPATSGGDGSDAGRAGSDGNDHAAPAGEQGTAPASAGADSGNGGDGGGGGDGDGGGGGGDDGGGDGGMATGAPTASSAAGPKAAASRPGGADEYAERGNEDESSDTGSESDDDDSDAWSD